MQIISFAWTTPALLAQAKDRTRRGWTADYARRFHVCMNCQGFDKGARNGGRGVAIVQLTQDPYLERTGKMTEEDYAGEGFLWMEQNHYTMRGQHPREYFEKWKATNEMLYVVHFQILRVIEHLSTFLDRSILQRELKIKQ